MSLSKQEMSSQIRSLALELGFTDCGFAPARELSSDAVCLRAWLDEGLHAGMGYMENHFDKRTNPALLVPGAKSAIIVLLNYFPKEDLPEENNYILSKYARGRDYHKVMKAMLKQFLRRIQNEIEPLQGRAFVDSAPLLERSLAAMAGLGWIGKNTNLISPRTGSFFFIGELLVDLELDYGQPIPDHCGGCTKCITACPTGAIIRPGVVDSRRCISYWTIEHKGEMDPALTGRFQDRIFGCDICQDVCPWNRRSASTTMEDFKARPELMAMSRKEWQTLTEERFRELFEGSAVMRAGFEGLMRNIRFLAVNE